LIQGNCIDEINLLQKQVKFNLIFGIL